MNLTFEKIVTFILLSFCFNNISLAGNYWQQRVEYKMHIDFDVKSHQYSGSQILKYYNYSPDTLYNIYYHLYLNAFQPNSMMDVRSRSLPDPDARVGSRISELTPEETGFIKVNSLNQSGTSLNYEVSETVLEVKLAAPIPPNTSATFEMQFDAQIPKQIRRTGRDSNEGIDYSVAQWFPKMAEYDEDGWHTSPYVGREFYAPWGDYEVDITIDKNYVLAGTGILQNPNEIGYGYEDEGIKVKHRGSKLTWKFKATNVHDFVWAADTEYTQIKAQVPNGPLVRFFYVPGEETKLWKDLTPYVIKALDYIQSHYGKYGWDEYHFIQGGDGGMEYPMATLIANKKLSGVRSFNSLIGVVLHELMHSWYQGMLATNESYYAWMDEGFTTFGDVYTENYVLDQRKDFPLANRYRAYATWAKTGREEPLTTHSDHFTTNYAYSVGSYSKGAVALEQLGYIIGTENRDAGLLAYYNEWAFKHPDMNDFIRVMEKQSGIELSWYFDYWIKSTQTIDYGIEKVTSEGKKTLISLNRIDAMPMPIDLVITKQNGDQILYYIPLTMMRGEKPNDTTIERIVGTDWPWTHPTYNFTLNIPFYEIASIEIDPSGRLADIDKSNNSFWADNSGEKTSNTPASAND